MSLPNITRVSRPVSTLISIESPPVAPPPPVPPFARSLIQGILEALMGRRPLHQLRPHLELRAFAHLVSCVDDRLLHGMRPGRLHIQMPSPQAVEASATVRLEQRWITCVIRLDELNSGWSCTDLAVLTPLAAVA